MARDRVIGYRLPGGFEVPEYGIFELPSKNGAHLLDESQSIDAIFEEPDASIPALVHLPGRTRAIIAQGIHEGCFSEEMLRGGDSINDFFELKSQLSCAQMSAIVRSSNHHQIFEAYVLRDLVGGSERDVKAYGFVAQPWIPERDVAVIDGIWSHDPIARQLLYRAVEHELKASNRMVRLCSGVNLEAHSSFFANMGFRFMQRNSAAYLFSEHAFPGRREMVKILQPAYDASLIDN